MNAARAGLVLHHQHIPQSPKGRFNPRGEKTTLAEIEQNGHPDALLKNLARRSRGDFRYVIWPVHTAALDSWAPYPVARAPGGNKVSTFWLKRVKRAA